MEMYWSRQKNFFTKDFSVKLSKNLMFFSIHLKGPLHFRNMKLHIFRKLTGTLRIVSYSNHDQ